LKKGGRPWVAALIWLATLGPFFFLSYGIANWITAQRLNVRSIVFGWEHRIPFLAWTIVPYWSIDFFYTLSFFLCRDRRELDSHAKRLLTAQIVSITCFLLFPLRFSFAQPQTSGLFGWMFHALGGFDKPFNQLPSLHLSLTTILWAKYSEHTRGAARFLLRCWFVLAGVSALTTYQHHFIDILPGIWVGLLCIALFPAQRVSALPSRRSVGIASFYIAGGGLLGLVGFWVGGLAWLLFWPASALLIVAAAYWIGSPQMLRGNAMIPVLAPYQAVRWIHLRWWTHGEPIAQEIADGVWLGRFPQRSERDALRISSMVNLAAELPPDTSGVVARSVPMLDLLVPTSEQLSAAVAAIGDLEASRPTLVCCALGYSRSAVSVAAWLVARDIATSADAAIAMIRSRRPAVVLTARHQEQLQQWASEARQCSSH
jgi:protein-tyrosine phosphatase/membrane-associated phospholipid phosphatase